METILDHNITDEEWKDLFGVKMSRSEYLDGLDQRKAYEHLFYLYRSRGNKKMAKRYLDMTPNDKHKFYEVLNVDFGAYKYFNESY